MTRLLTSEELQILVAQARKGALAAYNRLADAYRPAITAMAYQRTGNRDDADDLTQDVLARAWQKLSTLNDPSFFWPWLKTITANSCVNWNNRDRRETLVIETADIVAQYCQAHLSSEQIIREFKRQQIKRALAAIPAMNRLALLLHVLGGYDYAEIAVLCGTSANTVAGRISRAKAQLRRLLPDQGAELLHQPRNDKEKGQNECPLR